MSRRRLHHPEIGTIEPESSVFSVDGRPDLGMIVYNPATAGPIRSLNSSRAE